MKGKIALLFVLLAVLGGSMSSLPYPPLTLDISLDTTSCSDVTGPPCDGGTKRISNRTFFNDDPLAPQAFKNAFVSINHKANGVSTSTNNQDRALAFLTYNDLSDTSAHYAMEGIQGELDINGSPTFYGSPDGEAAAASFQVADNHTGVHPSPMLGVMGIRSQVFRRGDNWGSCPNGACWVGVWGRASNTSSVAGSSAVMAGGMFTVQSTNGNLDTAIVGAGVFLPAPNANNKMRYNRGLYVQDFGTGVNDFSIYSLGKNYFATAVIKSHTPVSSSEACTKDTVWPDANYLYVCNATNQIKRIALESF